MRTVMIAVLALVSGAAAPAARFEIPAAALEDKIRGGLLGQILGDLNGLPHEMKYINDPGDVREYVPALPEGAWTDDDTDIEWVYMVEIDAPRPAAAAAGAHRRTLEEPYQPAHLVLAQVPAAVARPRHRAAAHRLRAAESLGRLQPLRPVRGEMWGLVSPAMPRTAARTGLHYTHVSIEGEPAQATQLFTAMIATAFTTADMEKILDAGAAATDAKSDMRAIAADVRRWHRENPNDWRATRRLIRDKYSLYGGADVRDRNGVKLNGAATLAALLYGRGDFVETLRHAFNFGWDADNNAATAGTIIGVIKGQRWLMDQGWKITDRFRNTSRDAMPEDETITTLGDRLVRVAARQIQERGGSQARGVWRINAETPKNFEALGLRPLRLEKEIDRGLREGPRARAAYLAICLDRAPLLRARYPKEWARAVEELNAQAGVLRALFYESPVPAGERLRAAALAAGVKQPPAPTPRKPPAAPPD